MYKKYKGYSLIATILILGMILTVAVSLAFAAVMNRRASIGSSKSGVSYQKADEGVEKVMYDILGGTYETVDELPNCNAASGLIETSEYKVELRDELDETIDCDGSTAVSEVRKLKSVGIEANQTQRAVEAPVFISSQGGNDEYTVLLIHSDEADGSTSFTDSSPQDHSISDSGDVHHEEDEAVFGDTSIEFDGSGDYLSASDSDDWYFADGDFTIDLWANFSSLPSSGNWRMLYSQFEDENNLVYWGLYNNSGNYELRLISFDDSDSTQSMVRDVSFSTDTWYHLALVRNGEEIAMYEDGARIGSIYSNSNSVGDFNGNLFIGTYTGSEDYMDGYIDEIRVSKGIARWTEDFTPPSSPYSE